MSSSDSTPVISIDELMNLAADGDRKAAELFLGRFLSEILYVPNRQQPFGMSDQPEYPGDFVSILGIKDGERAIVPAFTAAELIEDWCGSKLEYRSLTGERLLSIMPDDWWICLNPGTGLEKEFSPWEIGQLKSGSASFADIIEELYADEGPAQLSVEPVAPGEFTNLLSSMKEVAKNFPNILKLYALKEGGQDSIKSSVLIGALISKCEESSIAEIQTALKGAADLAQIGAEPARVLVADNFDQSPQLSVFKVIQPFFEQAEASSGKGLFGLGRLFKK